MRFSLSGLIQFSTIGWVAVQGSTTVQTTNIAIVNAAKVKCRMFVISFSTVHYLVIESRNSQPKTTQAISPVSRMLNAWPTT